MAEDTRIIISAVDKTSRGFRSVSNGLKTLAKSVFSLKTAVVLAAGAAGFGFLIKKNLDSIDALKKTADKIGTTTDVLSGLQYAAQLTGVKQETLNMAMQRFTRRLAEAANGTGEAKGALQTLNIDAKKLLQLPLDEQMFAIADAMVEVETQAEVVALAMKLFDSEGVALVNTLGNGAGAMRDMMLEAEQLGLVLSHASAEGVEKANDAFTSLFAIIRGIVRQMTAALAPVIENIVVRTKEWALSLGDAETGIKGVGQTIARFLVGALISGVTGIQNLGNAVIEAGNKIRTAWHIFFGSEEAKAVQDQIDAISDTLRSNAIGASEGANELFSPKVISDYQAQMQALIVTRDELNKPPEMWQPLDFSFFISELTGLRDLIGSESGGLVDPLIDEFTRLGEPSMWQKIYNAFDQFGASVAKASPNVFDFQKQLDDLAASSMSGLTTALRDGITGATTFAEAFRNMASSIVNSLLDMAIQYYIVKPIFDAITGSAGSGLTGAPTGSMSTIGNQSVTAGGDFGGGSSGFFSGKAIGGSVQAGQPYMVGERGQEMFVPNQSGSIIPNNQLGGGGVVVNQTINISTGVAQTVRAEVANMMPQIAAAAKGAVADARQRGGGYSQALIGA
jgi:hypothetical protein